MKRVLTALFFMSLLLSCQKDEDPVGINTLGQVRLDNIGVSEDGSGIGALVVSHDGSKIYYAVVNFQTDRHELRMIDEHSSVTKIFSGDGQLDALDISKDDNVLLYSISKAYGAESKLYEYPLDARIASLLLTVTGDGYFWDTQYLPDGNIIFTQGDGRVNVSLRRLDRISKEVTILLDKSENPLLRDIDEASEQILLQGWSSRRILTMKFDGTELRDYGEQTTQIGPICFSPDGSEILAYQQGDAQAPQGSAELFMQAVSYDVQTGQKKLLTSTKEGNRPLSYGENKNELVIQIGNLFPMELSLYDRSMNRYDLLTNNQLSENFLGFYGNSSHRVLFQAVDQSGTSGLYIVNK